MRYLVDVMQNQADEISKLINTGKYNNTAQFIVAAIENQIYIENNDEITQHINDRAQNNSNVNEPARVLNNGTNTMILKNIISQPKVVPMPNFHNLAVSLYEAKEEKCWLWGQVNKILPIKIGLRALYAYMGSEQWADFEEYSKRVSDIAAKIGKSIRSYEDKRHKLRDERISAGLPSEEDKSKTRYVGQFLSYMRRDEKLDGAMTFLRFSNLRKDDKERLLIGITDAGLEFANLENPALDYSDFEKSFNEKEVEFYLNHITENVKGESGAIQWLLQKLMDGITNREKINDEVKKDFASIWKNSSGNDASKDVINTQRAGLMARMFELGLIGKDKKGVNVKYKILKKGKDFLIKQ